MALTRRFIHGVYRLSLAASRRRFQRAVRNCEAVQAQKLARLVAENSDTAYGRAHRFSTVSSVGEWQRRVPITDYDGLQPWVLRVAHGEPRVLTAAPVRIFERTSGSTAAHKLIPYTDELLAEFAAATGPWLYDLYTSIPQLNGTTSYWSISPALRAPERTAGGVPVGFDDDTEYFGSLARIALRRTLAVPTDVARAGDIETWTTATIRHLVAAQDLGLVSVWHPSFFTILLRTIERRLPELLSELPPRRRDVIRARLGSFALGEALWPRLAVVSCWADGPAADAVATLRPYVPHARIQPKGLLATEGVVSFPLMLGAESRGVAAVAGHFLEFIDVDDQQHAPYLAHELQLGGCYLPVISTGGGLYRYRLGDVVRCTGFHVHAPILRFEGRIDQVSDLCGEKLNAHMVANALRDVQRTANVTFAFALVVPLHDDPPRYRLYAEGVRNEDLAQIAALLEQAFCHNPGYQYARVLGQLDALDVVAVRDGAARYVQARIAAGQRAGDVKPVHLDARNDWRAVFGDPTSVWRPLTQARESGVLIPKM